MSLRPLLALHALASVVVILSGTWALLNVGSFGVVPPPSQKLSVAKAETTRYRYTPNFYRALVTHDARTYGLRDFDADSLRSPHRFQAEYRGRFVLPTRGKGLETSHLQIVAQVEKTWVTQGDARYRSDQLVLRITNRTNKHLAYFVDTTVRDEKACSSKGNRPHNALTLMPAETIMRSECLYHEHQDLSVLRVDVMEISAIGYYYVAQLPPSVLGVGSRIGEQHRLPKGLDFCRHVPRAELDAAGSVETRWSAVVDFYARHNCDEYWFFSGYRMREAPADSLEPSHPPK